MALPSRPIIGLVSQDLSLLQRGAVVKMAPCFALRGYIQQRERTLIHGDYRWLRRASVPQRRREASA